MSRRFGRKQRRRAREALTEANNRIEAAMGLWANEREARHMTQALLTKTAASNNELKSILSDIVEALPDGFIGAPAATRQCEGRPPEVGQPYRIAKTMPIDFDSLTATQAIARAHELHALIASVDVERFMGDKLHFNLQFSSGELRYTITDAGMRAISERNLIQQVAQLFARAIKEKFPS